MLLNLLFMTLLWSECELFNNKPVDELARVLLSFKRPTRVTRPHRTATVPIIRSFHFGTGRVTPNASSPRVLSTVFYGSVCLKVPHASWSRLYFPNDELSSWKVPDFGRSANAWNASSAVVNRMRSCFNVCLKGPHQQLIQVLVFEWSIKRCHFQWPWLTLNPVSRSRHFRRRISKNGAF